MAEKPLTPAQIHTAKVKKAKELREKAYKFVEAQTKKHMDDLAELKDDAAPVPAPIGVKLTITSVEGSVKDLFVWVLRRLIEDAVQYDGDEPNDYLEVLKNIEKSSPLAAHMQSVLPAGVDDDGLPEDDEYFVDALAAADQDKAVAAECYKAVMAYGKFFARSIAAQGWPVGKKITLQMAIAGMRIMDRANTSPSLFRTAFEEAQKAKEFTAAKKKV